MSQFIIAGAIYICVYSTVYSSIYGYKYTDSIRHIRVKYRKNMGTLVFCEAKKERAKGT